MKIYTKTGDKGTTSLVYGKRVAKNDLRVEAYGTTDEVNSFLGLSISQLRIEVNRTNNKTLTEVILLLEKIQNTLFYVGAELSTPADKEVKWKLKEEHINELEQAIDQFDATLTPLQQFILPGGHLAASHLHVARTIVRRAERLCVGIEQISPMVLAYLNRLSDLLFVLARTINKELSIQEPLLKPEN